MAENEKSKRKARRKAEREAKKLSKMAKAGEDQYEYSVGNMLQKVHSFCQICNHTFTMPCRHQNQVMATERMSQINQAVDNIMSKSEGKNGKESLLMHSFKKHRKSSNVGGSSRYS